mgnify:CR=1 FL=1
MMEEKDVLLSPKLLNQLGKQLGYSNSIPPQFIELASTLLMGGMSKQANSDEGADSLLSDIQSAREGENILGQLERDEDPDFSAAEKKQGLLDNLLGNKIDPLAEAFAQATGLPKAKAKQLMMILAPILLAMLAQKVSAGNRDDVKKEVKDIYKNPPRSKEEFRLEQEKLRLEQQKFELEQRKKELEKRQKDLENRKKALKSNANLDRKKYQIPNKEDQGLLEKLLDKDGDGNFVEEAVGLLKNLLLK